METKNRKFVIPNTFSGVIQRLSSLSANLHEFFNKAICITNHTKGKRTSSDLKKNGLKEASWNNKLKQGKEVDPPLVKVSIFNNS